MIFDEAIISLSATSYLDHLRPLTGSASAETVLRLLGHADVRITQEVYGPLCGKFLAQEASKLWRPIGPALIREIPPVPELPKVGQLVVQ